MNTIWMPSIEVESANGTREVNLSTHLFKNRKLFLNGSIDAESANVFLAELLYLEAEAAEKVTVYINSPGGEVNAGLMIYDALQGSSLNINLVCTGLAASMAAVILCGGKKGHRFILPHSKVMIHEPLIANGVGGSATSIMHISESIIETKNLLSEIMAKHTGKTVEEINNAILFDNFMDANEAVKFGLCDKIIKNVNI